MIFRSMTGVDRISGLVLAKSTFHEAIREVFNTFEYERLERLQANIINVMSLGLAPGEAECVS